MYEKHTLKKLYNIIFFKFHNLSIFFTITYSSCIRNKKDVSRTRKYRAKRSYPRIADRSWPWINKQNDSRKIVLELKIIRLILFFLLILLVIIFIIMIWLTKLFYEQWACYRSGKNDDNSKQVILQLSGYGFYRYYHKEIIIRSIPMFSIQKLGVTCLNVVKNVVPQDERILFQSLKNYRKHAHWKKNM